jgi:[acyl-carrier-protein] S-malonyltransferase
MKLAFLFPGQGSQAVGMGASLYASSAAAKTILDTIDDVLGYKLTEICFNGPEDRLKETDITQPALFAVSVAALASAREAGIEATVAAGHSVGEYAALVAAGALSVADGAKLVSKRGSLMKAAAQEHPGSMAAVLGLEASVVAEIVAKVSAESAYVGAANFNSGGQVVISGETEGVAIASARLQEAGAKKIIPLAVSGAFHSKLMLPAAEKFRATIASAQISAATIPVVANVTASYETEPDEIRENLALQIASSVRWEETLQLLVADGCDTFIELGSGKVLTNIVKRFAKGAKTANISDEASLAATLELLKS